MFSEALAAYQAWQAAKQGTADAARTRAIWDAADAKLAPLVQNFGGGLARLFGREAEGHPFLPLRSFDVRRASAVHVAVKIDITTVEPVPDLQTELNPEMSQLIGHEPLAIRLNIPGGEFLLDLPGYRLLMAARNRGLVAASESDERLHALRRAAEALARLAAIEKDARLLADDSESNASYLIHGNPNIRPREPADSGTAGDDMTASAELDSAVAAALAARGFALEGDALVRQDGERITVPALGVLGNRGDLDDFPSGLPSRARGDAREKTLYNIAQDAGGLSQKQRIPANSLADELGPRLGADDLSKRVLASVMRRQYWVTPTRRQGATGSPFIIPFHIDLPATWGYTGRYKSFRGNLLMFLSWNGAGEFDLQAAAQLIDFLSDDDGLTILDRGLLRAARETADTLGAAWRPSPVSNHLVASFGEAMRERFANGCFDTDGLRRIRNDLSTTLNLQLPRHDKVAALVQGLSINLALYYYRLAYTLGEGITACNVATSTGTLLPEPDFSGRLLFRVGAGGDRPVRLTEPCSQSYLELDRTHLTSLVGSIVTANILHGIEVQAGLATSASVPMPYRLARAVQGDAALAERVDALAAVLAIRFYDREAADDNGEMRDSLYRQAADPGSGCFRAAQAVMAVFQQPKAPSNIAAVTSCTHSSARFAGRVETEQGPGQLLRTRRIRSYSLLRPAHPRQRTDRPDSLQIQVPRRARKVRARAPRPA